MPEYIVQKPVDFTKLTPKAKKSLPEQFDVTPKFDGCCAVLLFANRLFVGAYSATGEHAPSMDFIGGWIQQHWWLPIENVALIGEAWFPGTDFPTISGRFRRKSAQNDLVFAPFDAAQFTWDEADENPTLHDERPYTKRVELFVGQPHSHEYVVSVPHFLTDLADANEKARRWKAEGGYDGAIARNPDSPYTVGRCKSEVIKLKPVLSLDLEVQGWKTEPGEKTGRSVLTLEVAYQGKTSWVGSGVPHDLYGGDLIGKIVEVECMGLTPDGKLREPRFKGVRHDKIEAD